MSNYPAGADTSSAPWNQEDAVWPNTFEVEQLEITLGNVYYLLSGEAELIKDRYVLKNVIVNDTDYLLPENQRPISSPSEFMERISRKNEVIQTQLDALAENLME